MSISRNAAYNALGSALPSILTLVTVPIYLRFVGVERYGLLTLCWVILGYSTYLDLGLGPALARLLSEKRDRGPAVANRIFWTGLWFSLALGVIAGAAIFFAGRFYFSDVANVDGAFEREVGEAIPLLAATAPILLLGSALGGVLQSRERFLEANLLGSTSNILLAVLPLLLAVTWAPHLTALIAGALAARLLPAPLALWVAARVLPAGRPCAPSLTVLKELVSFGSWMSLAALAIGILNTIDRLLIGSRISPAAVAAFALPHSLVSRIILIPHSLGSALFPRFAYLPASEHRALLTASVQAVAVLTSPITIVLIAVSEPFFTIWIGPELTRISAPLAHILAVGFWAYCVGYPAFSMLQAIGRPDLVAKLHLFELPLFAAGIVGAIYFFGLTGAALALTLRFVFETSILFRLVATSRAAARLLAAPALLVVGAAVAASELQGVLRYGILAVLLLACLLWSFLNIPPVLRPYTDRLAGLIRRGRERMSRQV